MAYRTSVGGGVGCTPIASGGAAGAGLTTGFFLGADFFGGAFFTAFTAAFLAGAFFAAFFGAAFFAAFFGAAFFAAVFFFTGAAAFLAAFFAAFFFAIPISPHHA